MHWETYKRLLISALVPAAVLAALLLFLATSGGAHGSCLYSIGYFDADPLGVALDFIAALAICGHLVYLNTGKAHPRHRGYFVAGACTAALVANGAYVALLSRTAHFFGADSASTFFITATAFYCVYRLVVLLPLHTRKWLTPVLATYLFALGAVQAAHLCGLSQLPCVGGPPVLWLELTGHCPG